MRGARLIRHASLALAMASAVWVSAVMGPGPAASAKQGTVANSTQLTSLLNQLKAEGDLAAQSQVKTLLVKVDAEQTYLQQLNQRLATDQETAAVLQDQMAADRNALTNLVSTAYVDGNGSQAVADALAAPSLSQFLSSTTLPAAIASQVAGLVGNMQHDQQVVSADTKQLIADESQAMALQQQLGSQSQQLLAQLSNPQPALGSGSWAFAYGDCTWYVATQRKVTWGGNAYQWWANAAAAGYSEGQAPKVGSIVVWGQDVPGYSYSYGHVAYVQAVQGNQFEVSEMNFSAPGGGWDRVDYRWVTAGAGYLGFIYGAG
ncbi:MAG: CHAP domain-containing protein [Candidatus Dormibacteria bacterium]